MKNQNDASQPPSSQPPSARGSHQPRSSARLWAGMAGAALALACAVGYFISTLPARLPEITPERFAAAEKLWEQAGPRSYLIEVHVSGLQSAVYIVEMNDGEVVTATRNGDPLPAGRTRGIWSVPGMFSTIEFDLANAADRPPPQPGVPAIRVTPLGTFDKTYGYPARYRRIEWGATVEASWEVTRFEPRN